MPRPLALLERNLEVVSSATAAASTVTRDAGGAPRGGAPNQAGGEPEASASEAGGEPSVYSHGARKKPRADAAEPSNYPSNYPSHSAAAEPKEPKSEAPKQVDETVTKVQVNQKLAGGGAERVKEVEFLEACELFDYDELVAFMSAAEKKGSGLSVRCEDEKGEMPLHKLARSTGRPEKADKANAVFQQLITFSEKADRWARRDRPRRPRALAPAALAPAARRPVALRPAALTRPPSSPPRSQAEGRHQLAG